MREVLALADGTVPAGAGSRRTDKCLWRIPGDRPRERREQGHVWSRCYDARARRRGKLVR
ncbi:hypothetical protein ACE1SV_76590 [Streptomyces sennicomposti]